MSEFEVASASSSSCSLEEQDSHLVFDANALEFLHTQFDGEFDNAAAYPLSLADSDLSTSSAHSCAEMEPNKNTEPRAEQSQPSWAISRFLHDTDRIDSIRLGQHRRQDAKSHSQTLMADLDAVLDALQAS